MNSRQRTEPGMTETVMDKPQQSNTGQQGPQGQTSTTRQQSRLRNLLGQLSRNALALSLVAGATVIAITVALFLWAGNPAYRVLFANLSESDGGTIINELDNRGIPYRLGAGGQTILVPGKQVHQIRLQLAEQGLPRGGNVGFELMDNQSFGISQFAEQVNYQRSLEGELARSMESMHPVMAARVHLSMAKQSVFLRDREPAKASVILSLHPGRTLAQNQVSAIMHLVSSAVPELSSEHVAVVSASGELLSGRQNGHGIDGDNLAYVQEVERLYKNRIENILAPLFGRGNIHIQVTADIDFSVREETQESYRPNQDSNAAAVRSSQTSGALRGQNLNSQGIPGALSNTPPGWVPSAIDQDPTVEADGEAERDLQYDNVINYEVDRNITHIQHEQGEIQRLSVAAVVNYREVTNEDGSSQWQPLSGAELEEVNSLIRQAMGFSAARGDELEVVNSPFTSSPDSELPPRDWWSNPGIHNVALTFSRYLIAVLFAWFAYSKVLKPLLQRIQPPAPEPAIAGLPGGISAPPPTMPERADPAVETASQDESKRQRKSTSYEQDLRDVRRIAEEDPRLVAMVIRSWMNKHD